jgi:uncharacterized membrane protein YoaK (UPF0700 family)
MNETRKRDLLMWTGFATVFGTLIGALLTQPPVWVVAFVILGTAMVVYAIAHR